jgi:hypothetical protein
MQRLFQVIFTVIGLVSLVSFLGGFISSFPLSLYDRAIEKARREPPGFRWLPKRWPALKKENFPENVQYLWVIRDRCLKTFAISVGLLAIGAVVAVFCGLDLPLK